MPPKRVDLTGIRVGALTVLGPAEDRRDYAGALRAWWRCVCACGRKLEVSTIDLTRKHNGGTRRRACSQPCAIRKWDRKRPLSRRVEYNNWRLMMERCYDKTDAAYVNYGARGIKVCKRWHDFSLFLADMGKRPPSKPTLDRIDNDGDYAPKNCRWSSRFDQNSNKRSNRLLTFKDKTMTLAAWSRATGIPRGRIAARIDKFGWSVEEALTVSKGVRVHHKHSLRN